MERCYPLTGVSDQKASRESSAAAYGSFFDSRCVVVFACKRFVDFLAINRDIAGSYNTNPNLIPTNLFDDNFNVVANPN